MPNEDLFSIGLKVMFMSCRPKSKQQKNLNKEMF